jgi:hypothetical protein
MFAALTPARRLGRLLGRRPALPPPAETVRAFLDADLVDELHLVLVPVVRGRGRRLWDGQERLEGRFDIEVLSGGSGVTHLLLTRRA